MTENEQRISPDPEESSPTPADVTPSPGRWARVRVAAKALMVTLLVALTLKTFVIEAFRIPSGSMENTLLVGDFLLVNKLAYGLKTPHYLPLTAKTIPSFTLPAFGSVKRGDVVIFEYPGEREDLAEDQPVYFIKRCVGLPGDTVSLQHDAVSINGREVMPPTYAKVPRGMSLNKWGSYGPVVVPKEGDSVKLTLETIAEWKTFIEREGHRVEIDPEGTIRINGSPASSYSVERNYYFVLGDNRGNSLDSRSWGFLPEGSIVGEALLIYWSWDPEIARGGMWERLANIRWNRVGTLIR